jgi:ADP-ribose pyrophosphatase
MDTLFECENFSVRRVNLQIRSVWQQFEIVTRPEVVLCIPRTTDGDILLIRQLRASVNEEVIEFPAGRVESGETIEEAARRELREEVGFSVNTLNRVGRFLTAVHFSDEMITVFIADGEIVSPASPTPKEELRQIIKIAGNSIRELIANDSVVDAKTIAAYALVEAKGIELKLLRE